MSYDPIDGSDSVAYESKHRFAAAQCIHGLEPLMPPIDIILIAVAMIDLVCARAHNYADAVDNALAMLAQIPGAIGGPGQDRKCGRIAAGVIAECEKIYAERVAESPRVS